MKIILVLSACIIAAASVGCAGPAELPTKAAPAPSLMPAATSPVPTGSATPGQPLDYLTFLGALRSSGVQVDTDGEVDQPFFDVSGHLVKVNGQDIQVFEFDDAAAMESASATISPSGDSTGTTMITWIGPPHFYKSGRIIVLYVGDDKNVKDVLQSVLGPQFAGR